MGENHAKIGPWEPHGISLKSILAPHKTKVFLLMLKIVIGRAGSFTFLSAPNQTKSLPFTLGANWKIPLTAGQHLWHGSDSRFPRDYLLPPLSGGQTKTPWGLFSGNNPSSNQVPERVGTLLAGGGACKSQKGGGGGGKGCIPGPPEGRELGETTVEGRRGPPASKDKKWILIPRDNPSIHGGRKKNLKPGLLAAVAEPGT